MTEIERQLSEALQSLSAQYEREQRSAAGWIAGLSKQVSRITASSPRTTGESRTH